MMKTSMAAGVALVVWGSVFASACDGADVGEADLGEVMLRPGGFGCGVCGGGIGNAPVVNDSALHEFSLDGTFNADGLRILGAQFPGEPMFDLIVDPVHEQWIGLDTTDHQPIVFGSEMLGAQLILETPDGQLSLEIVDYDDEVPSWSGSGPPITAYRGMYKDVNGNTASLCPSQSIENQWFTLIAGETYGRATNRVHANRPAWVTIACVGEAAAKMKMLGYHAAGDLGTTAAMRQATLRMITADYCGTGQSFTVSGTPVAWRDGLGTVEPPFDEATMEAKWGPDGALCLDTPRFADPAVIADACEIPSCDGDLEFSDAVVWRTMLP